MAKHMQIAETLVDDTLNTSRSPHRGVPSASIRDFLPLSSFPIYSSATSPPFPQKTRRNAWRRIPAERGGGAAVLADPCNEHACARYRNQRQNTPPPPITPSAAISRLYLLARPKLRFFLCLRFHGCRTYLLHISGTACVHICEARAVAPEPRGTALEGRHERASPICWNPLGSLLACSKNNVADTIRTRTPMCEETLTKISRLCISVHHSTRAGLGARKAFAMQGHGTRCVQHQNNGV